MIKFKISELVDIHDGIESTLLILQSRLKNHQSCKNIKLIKEYANLPLVECYPGLLNQVFMNILANAIDAIEEGIGSGEWGNEGDEGDEGVWGGRFLHHPPTLPMPNDGSCSTWGDSKTALPPQCPMPQIRIRTELIDDMQVIIRIADNGSGIPESLQKRLFDPFFTTKPVGKGTGLGLSISHQIIVEKHRGQLQCISALGKGTEFIIKIPVELSSCF